MALVLLLFQAALGSLQAEDALAQPPLVALVARLVKDLVTQGVGQVLLRDPVVRKVVRVQVALAVAEPLAVAVAVLRGSGGSCSRSSPPRGERLPERLVLLDLGAVAR